MEKVFNVNRSPRGLIVSYKSDEKFIDYIKGLGFEVVLSTKANVDPRIDDHPDLQIRHLFGRDYIVARDCYDYYSEALKGYGLNLIKSERVLNSKYPGDCILNVSQIGEYYITKEGAIDPALERELKSKGLKAIYQKQAYANCMTIAFNDFAITNDRSIEKALKEKGIEVYCISPEGIGLDGFNIGFLGGSCGIIGDMKLLFTGDISQLREYDKLKEILDKNAIEVFYPQLDLLDLGSIISIF